jgi:hypothetical protein
MREALEEESTSQFRQDRHIHGHIRQSFLESFVGKTVFKNSDVARNGGEETAGISKDFQTK